MASERDQAKRLKDLEKENSRLKQLLADVTIEDGRQDGDERAERNPHDNPPG